MANHDHSATFNNNQFMIVLNVFSCVNDLLRITLMVHLVSQEFDQ